MSVATSDVARLLLGGIRLINGAIALFAPHVIMGRFDTKDVPVAAYGLRMFGIRTILIALDLFRGPGDARDRAVRVAPLIHASDLVAATVAARSGRVAMRTGALVVAISALNTVLALVMQRSGDSSAVATAHRPEDHRG